MSGSQKEVIWENCAKGESPADVAATFRDLVCPHVVSSLMKQMHKLAVWSCLIDNFNIGDFTKVSSREDFTGVMLAGVLEVMMDYTKELLPIFNKICSYLLTATNHYSPGVDLERLKLYASCCEKYEVVWPLSLSSEREAEHTTAAACTALSVTDLAVAEAATLDHSMIKKRSLLSEKETSPRGDYKMQELNRPRPRSNSWEEYVLGRRDSSDAPAIAPQ